MNHIIQSLALTVFAAWVMSTTECTRTCTAEATASVSVAVVEASNAPVSEAVVRYAVNGGEQKDCSPWDEGDSTFVCGFGEEVTFLIAAEGWRRQASWR